MFNFFFKSINDVNDVKSYIDIALVFCFPIWQSCSSTDNVSQLGKLIETVYFDLNDNVLNLLCCCIFFRMIHCVFKYFSARDIQCRVQIFHYYHKSRYSNILLIKPIFETYCKMSDANIRVQLAFKFITKYSK